MSRFNFDFVSHCSSEARGSAATRFFSGLFSGLVLGAVLLSAPTSVSASSGFVWERGLSPVRPISAPAELYIKAASHNLDKTHRYSLSESALNRKSENRAADWARVPTVTKDQLKEGFLSIRDEKFFVDSDQRARRATWLYPDDGCFVRAAIAAEHFERQTNLASAKIFAFGNLQVKTDNSPEGAVGWWYHVAAVGKVLNSSTGKAVVYVYDPAIDPTNPIEVSMWLQAMSAPQAEISICLGGTYDPSSNCDDAITAPSQRARSEAHWFLSSEWERMLELQRDPAKELGDFPPWR